MFPAPCCYAAAALAELKEVVLRNIKEGRYMKKRRTNKAGQSGHSDADSDSESESEGQAVGKGRVTSLFY